ncbi:MAG: hypothetical protein ACOCV2_00235 [Persicimonas sp.]
MAHRVAAWLVGPTALLVIAASGCSDVGRPCQTDSDCDSGSICFEETCYARCEEDDDCLPSDKCEVQTRQVEDSRETVNICVDEDFRSDDSDEGLCGEPGECCSSDDDCTEELGDDRAVCGDHDRCLIPVELSHAILITDRTDVDEDEQVDEGPGADIAHVYARTSEEPDPIGYGTTLEYAPADGAEEGPGAELDGTSRPLDDSRTCVEGDFDEYAMSLGGDEGTLLVAFDDTTGQPLELTPDMEVVVLEWGENCGVSDDPDRYDVRFCETQQLDSTDDNRGIDPQTDCETPLDPQGDASGRTVFDLDET